MQVTTHTERLTFTVEDLPIGLELEVRSLFLPENEAQK